MKRPLLRQIRTRIIISCLLVALIPLLILAFVNRQTSKEALGDNAKQALLAAARETANSIDSFIQQNLKNIKVEATLPGLVEYLTLTPQQKKASASENLALITLQRLSNKDIVNLISYSLLDLKGQNILTTGIRDFQVNESQQDYFQEPLKTRQPFASSLRRSPLVSDLVMIFFSAPVVDKTGKIVGVLRVAYSVTGIQQLVNNQNNRVGNNSFAILLDENHIYLANSIAPGLLFKPIMPLGFDVTQKLLKQGRLIQYPIDEPGTNLPDLKRALNTGQNFLITSLKSNGDASDLVAITRIESKPWSLIFAQPIKSAFFAINKQLTQSLQLILVIALIVFILAFILGQLLTSPLIHLTQTVSQFTAGNLKIRARIFGGDEIGQLARSFNAMAADLQQAFTTLENKVQERTAQLSDANQEITNLNEKLKSENLRMTAELYILQQMQNLVLPKSNELEIIKHLEIAAFMESADEVGGDYYDILYTDGVVTIGIGDVTGHGLESGLLMVMTQTAVRLLLEIKEKNLKRFLDVLNRTLYKNIQRMNSSKNLTLAILNYVDGKITIAGQHEQVLVVRGGGKIEAIDTIDLGFPIGLTEDIGDFINQTYVELLPGDGVVLYTDGIPEATNLANKFYGLERFCQVISQNWDHSAEEIKQLLIDDLRQFVGKQKMFDDITLVVFKRPSFEQ